MRLMYQQLWRQIGKDKLFLCLLLVLTMLTSLSFFFTMFGIDGNVAALNALPSLSENQQLYQNALNSNTYLAFSFLSTLTGLCALVFILFFYRFFKANRKQIGCMKALGTEDSRLQLFFVAFTAILSLCGALLGLLGGYMMSDILIRANAKTYAVTGLIKEIGTFSLVIGLFSPAIVLCIVAYLCYGFIRNKEAGLLLSGGQEQRRLSIAKKVADKISRLFPKNMRLSLRIALQKPLSVLFIFVAVMSFSVCVILGQSLHISSAKVFQAQTTGHNYEYDIRFSAYQTAEVPKHTMIYLESPSIISAPNHTLERSVTGLYTTNAQFALKNANNELLSPPDANTVYINSELFEIYGINVSDTLAVEVAGLPQSFVVKDIAVNAKSSSIYMNAEQLCSILSVPTGAYNGAFSENILSGGEITTKAQRIEQLNRNAVSNQVSGVINQAIGILIGSILMFLALYINFQDNTHDILVLNLLGLCDKAIRKMLIDVYFPILCTAFVATLAPSIFLAQTIQRSLSISTNDYMPFGISALVILAAFCLLSLIYWGVQLTFRLGIQKVIANSKIADLIYAQ